MGLAKVLCKRAKPGKDLVFALGAFAALVGGALHHGLVGRDEAPLAFLGEPDARLDEGAGIGSGRDGLGMPRLGLEPAPLHGAGDGQLGDEAVHPRPEGFDGVKDEGGAAVLVAVEDAEVLLRGWQGR